MDNRTKLILSVVGIGAVVIPAGLLITLTPKKVEEPATSSTSRQIDTKAVEETVKNLPKKEIVFPSVGPSTPSARPTSEASPSAR